MQEQRTMMLLPLFFVIFIIQFLAGLILYWIMTNTWTMGQQWVIRKGAGQSYRAPRHPLPRRWAVATAGARPRVAKGDGGGVGGGLSGSLRGKPKPEEKQPATVESSTRTRYRAQPPPATAQEEEAFRTPALAMGTGTISGEAPKQELRPSCRLPRKGAQARPRYVRRAGLWRVSRDSVTGRALLQ
jgi:YidC/Oxa1 family membrane protein insertase